MQRSDIEQKMAESRKVRPCMHACMCVCMHACLCCVQHAFVCARTHACVYISIRLYVCMCIYQLPNHKQAQRGKRGQTKRVIKTIVRGHSTLSPRSPNLVNSRPTLSPRSPNFASSHPTQRPRSPNSISSRPTLTPCSPKFCQQSPNQGLPNPKP